MSVSVGKPVVLVVGAAGGIGIALCRRLAAQGATLLLAGGDEGKLVALSAEVGGDVLPLDARDIDAVGSVVKGLSNGTVAWTVPSTWPVRSC